MFIQMLAMTNLKISINTRTHQSKLKQLIYFKWTINSQPQKTKFNPTSRSMLRPLFDKNQSSKQPQTCCNLAMNLPTFNLMTSTNKCRKRSNSYPNKLRKSNSSKSQTFLMESESSKSIMTYWKWIKTIRNRRNNIQMMMKPN